MLIVHVIPNPKLGQRHEEHFPDDTTPEQILLELTKPHPNRNPLPGRPLTLPPRQDGYGLIAVSEDPEEPGVSYLDHPETRVVIGRSEIVAVKAKKGQRGGPRKDFIEIKTIHGPEAKP